LKDAVMIRDCAYCRLFSYWRKW